ncbi:MCP four helix bundle domain-containing protein [Pseudomonas sp. NPDC047961]
MFLRNIGIAPRATLSFGLVAFLLLCVGVFSLTQMSKMDMASKDVGGNWVPSVTNLNEINQAVLRQRIHTLRLASLTDEAAVAESKAGLTELAGQISQRSADYAKYLTGAEETKWTCPYQTGHRNPVKLMLQPTA